jgi:hypothetical protein
MIDEGRKVSGRKFRFGTPASGKIPSLDVFSPSPSERLTKKKKRIQRREEQNSESRK